MVVVLAVEILLVPLLCGCWLDICTLELQGVALATRLEFHFSAPWASTFVHWLVGMLFMHAFASFIGVLRNVLREGTLWILRDPFDPAFHPVKHVLETPLGRYALRLVAMTAFYLTLLALMLFAPIKTVNLLKADAMPWRLMLRHPLELLLSNLIVPFLYDRLDVGSRVADFVAYWVEHAAPLVGLQHYLLAQVKGVRAPSFRGSYGWRASEAEGTRGPSGGALLVATHGVRRVMAAA